jgi:hypothetical protein
MRSLNDLQRSSKNEINKKTTGRTKSALEKMIASATQTLEKVNDMVA